MKNFLIVLILLLCIVSKGFSQLLEEHFEYAAGDSIGAHGWVSNSGGTANRIIVTSPGLEFSGDPSTNIGNATRLTNTGQDEYKPFSVNQNTGSVYAYFMVNVDTAKSGDYFAAMLTSTSASTYICRAYVKDSAGSIAFGISKTTEAVTYTPAVYSRGTVYFLILKYDFVAGVINDRVSLFVFTDIVPALEPTPTIGPLTPVTGADPADLGRFALRQGTASSAPTLQIDGITVTGSWNSLLPVELQSFTSVINDRSVTLNWSTSSELNNSGFTVERANDEKSWSAVGFVNGNGTTINSSEYAFIDRALNTGRYKYRLKQTDFNGNFIYYDLNNEVYIGVPMKFNLSQNYPNPFNPSTFINFDIPFDGIVNLSIFDMSGKKVAEIVNGYRTSGYYSVSFNASHLASGLYLYKVSSGNFVSAKKMMIVK